MSAARGPLSHLRVLDLSRILAGPWASQLFADFGAEVIKVERPGRGDDTRAWGPPWLDDRSGRPTGESAYYLCANRGKRSLTLDLAHPDGQDIARRLAADSDVVIENFRAGRLADYGLDDASLRRDNPGLIYCSITGFGQDGPDRDRPGYDFMIQAMGGLMSVTGDPEGTPQRAGVAVADLFTGMYAATAVLAALAHRERTGQGQHIDLALFDVQLACLANQASNYLVSGESPGRIGNGHPNIVPYQAFATRDGHIVVAVGNDAQFRALCEVAQLGDLHREPRFATNAERVRHREALVPLVAAGLAGRRSETWLRELTAAGIPCGPINSIEAAFDEPQARARGMIRRLPHPLAGEVPVVANPVRFSVTPTIEPAPPPTLGQHTDEVLRERLGLSAQRIDALRRAGVV